VELQKGFVHEDSPCFHANHDRVGHVLNYSPVMLLALAQCLFGFFALGDIDEGRDDAF
jgi:hypothetical protein